MQSHDSTSTITNSPDTKKASQAPLNRDANEIEKFSKLAARWWDPQGESKPLHDLNPVRLRFLQQHGLKAGQRVLDVGCGGGLLSEAMAKVGVVITALDLSEDLIEIAKLHALESQLTIDYRVQAVEELATQDAAGFDCITCMEMLEHVPDPASVIQACTTLLKPGGRLFLSTLNRTPTAFLTAIVGAEYVLRLLPRGTHRYHTFIKPSELSTVLRDCGMQLLDIRGMKYEPFSRRAWLSARVDVNYILCAEKPIK